MAHIISSYLLDEAARLCRRWEDADANMRRHWPDPPKEVVTEWNKARRAAEAVTRTIIKELGI